MIKHANLTAEEARAILEYDPSGVFAWRARRPEMFISGAHSAEWQCRNWNSRRAGKLAGTLHPGGHIIIRIFKINYKAHRLAWLIVTGEWPEVEIDHANGIGSDNRFVNLRKATHAQNGANRGAQSNNTSGFKGVDYHKQTNKWRARIKVNGIDFHLGLYDNKEDAAIVYKKAAIDHCGEFARSSQIGG
jgi:hypothetical protein